MIYTEEDLQQAYAMGYNEAVDDVNEYYDEASMEFSLDDDYSAYDEDSSIVEDMVMNEAKLSQEEKNKIMRNSGRKDLENEVDDMSRDETAGKRWREGKPASRPNEHLKQHGKLYNPDLKERLAEFKKNK